MPDDVVAWPARGESWTLDQVIAFCRSKELSDLEDYVLDDPPPRPFVSDGCSAWFDRWFGLDLYPHCLIHDVWYWAGKPGDRSSRRRADEELLRAVRSRGRPVGAGLMWLGVRMFGGSWVKNRNFSWGFGRM